MNLSCGDRCWKKVCLPITLHDSTNTLTRVFPPLLAFKNYTTPMQGIHTHLSLCPPSLFPSMSTNGLPNANNLYGKPARHRRDSGEIDVFEAARYFSEGIDGVGHDGRLRFHAAVNAGRVACRAERKSLDSVVETMQAQHPRKVEKHNKEKKSKQPSSPGARLASFLNSFFLQTASKKKAKSLKDEEGLGGRRRRFSISDSQSIRSSESKYIYSSKGSGFRTPLPYPDTPTKSNKSSQQPKSVAWYDRRVVDETCVAGETKFADEFLGKNRGKGNGWLENCGRLQGDGFVGVDVDWGDGFAGHKWVLKRRSDLYSKEDRICANQLTSKEKQSSRRNKEDDDDDASYSSSDLFELKNVPWTDPSTCPPIHGTTDMEAIKREAAVAGASF